jgi:predicted amidohydrolase
MAIKVALLQMQTGPDRDENLAKAEDLLTVAAGEGADLAVLPEMFAIPYTTELMLRYREPLDGETAAMLRAAAAANHISILGGTFPEAREDGRCHNTSLFVDASGEVRGIYRKTHLFDVDFKGVHFQESEAVAPGDSVTVVDTAFGKIGIAVCFDLRFPGLFRNLAAAGAWLVLVPAVFTVATGQAHWELLVRSRALDNQLFVCGCQAASAPGAAFDPWGHSLVVDPLGSIIAGAERSEAIIYAELDPEVVDWTRKSLPLDTAARPELYS